MSRTDGKPVLVVGSEGMLGRDVVRCAGGRGHDVVAVDGPTDIDITDKAAVDALISSINPGVVINCAAYTDVDGAEADEATATAVNGHGLTYLAGACHRTGSLLVHYSTDYVFDGAADSPIAVDAVTRPINAYGRSKLAGEVAIHGSGCEHLILRTSWLYGTTGANFVKTMLRLGVERDSLRIVDDQFGRPTFTADLATWTFEMLAADVRGVFHIANGGECSWYDFAREIMRNAGIDCGIEPCTTAEFPRPAARPPYSVLDLTATDAVLGPLRAWQDALGDCLNQLAAHTTSKEPS